MRVRKYQNRQEKRRQALALAAFTVIWCLPGTALSQAPAEPEAGAEEMITVTGSRIKQAGLESVSPLLSIGAEEVSLQGTFSAETLINSLPQVQASYTSSVAYTNTGFASLNLRGLGAERSLVLVNGKRLMPGDPFVPVADIGIVPPTLIERVDLVSGGASAVYGSDAVAGVANFILRRNFTGLQIDGQTGFALHVNNDPVAGDALRRFGKPIPDNNPDAFRYSASIVLGTNFAGERGNITVFGSYLEADEVLRDDRDFGACVMASTVPTATSTTLTCNGTAINSFGRFVPSVGTNAGRSYQNNVNGTRTFTTPYVANAAYQPDLDTAPQAPLLRDDRRINLGGTARIEFSNSAEFYADMLYSVDKTSGALTTAQLFFGVSQTINCDNPLMSDQQRGILCAGLAPTANTVGLYSYYGGGPVPRSNSVEHRSLRAVGGFKGRFANNFDYDVYLQYGQSRYRNETENDWSIARISRGLQVVLVNGVPTCKSKVSGVDPNCVPLDIFQGSGNLRGAAEAYLSDPSWRVGQTREVIASGSISGDLGPYGLRSPFATNGAAIAIGAEYRDVRISQDLSDNLVSGDQIGTAGPLTETSGGFNLWEVFGELRVPLVENRPFFKSLALEGGLRYSNYNLSGGATTYKIGAHWALSSDLRLRASFNRAVRAPNAVELFNPQTKGVFSGQDPCSGATPTFTAAQCANTGVTTAQYGNIIPCNSNQCGALLGGNPALKPEKSETYNLGVILTPGILPGFSATVDYFDIRIADTIGTLSGAFVLSQCATIADPTFCSLIQRDQFGALLAGGASGQITLTNQNIGSLRTRGIDIDVRQRFDLSGIGLEGNRLVFSLTGTLTNLFFSQPVKGGASYNCVGLFGPTCGQPRPEWRHSLRSTWQSRGGFDLSLAWRYIGPTKLDRNSGLPGLAGAIDNPSGSIKAYNYFDVSWRWDVNDKFALRGGMLNIADTGPPVLSNAIAATQFFGNGNTYSGMYDVLGRQFFLGVTAKY